jgi:thiamine-phosphate pyrophosphorylase
MLFPRSGLYAITQMDGKSAAQVVKDVELVIVGGARVIQYRDKNPHRDSVLAGQLLALCHHYAISLIINDNIDLAAEIGADGVHLGKHDADMATAKQRLGEQAIIGVSCYNDVNLAIAAEKQGASYVAFGRFFPSQSKPLASPAQLETLHQAKTLIHLPIVAIGGILPSNGKCLIEAGADLLAVIGGVFTDNVKDSASAYQTLFSTI